MVNLSLEGLTVPLKLDTGSHVNIQLISYYKMLKADKNMTDFLHWRYNTDYWKDIYYHQQKRYVTRTVLHYYFEKGLSHTRERRLRKIERKWVNLIQIPNKNNVLSAYKELFTEIDCLPERVSIKLKHNAVPVIEAWRKIPFTMLNEVKAELDRTEEAGVIKRITQPKEWVSVKHIVHKSDEKLRICLNPRNLNKATLREHFKLPTRKEVKLTMVGAKIFPKLDC